MINQKQISKFSVATIAELEAIKGGVNPNNLMCFCAENKTLYMYVSSGAIYTVNHIQICATGDSVLVPNSRWVGIAGIANYFGLAAGNDTEIQINDTGLFGSSPNLIFNATSSMFTTSITNGGTATTYKLITENNMLGYGMYSSGAFASKGVDVAFNGIYDATAFGNSSLTAGIIKMDGTTGQSALVTVDTDRITLSTDKNHLELEESLGIRIRANSALANSLKLGDDNDNDLMVLNSGVWNYKASAPGRAVMNIPTGVYPTTPAVGDIVVESNYMYRWDGLSWLSIASPQVMPTTFVDSTFAIYDDGNPTRTMNFQVGNITAGQTRTAVMPDRNFYMDVITNNITETSIPTNAVMFVDDTSGNVTGNANELSYYNGSKVFKYAKSAIAGTTADNFLISNSTVATSGVQQFSPSLSFYGSQWNGVTAGSHVKRIQSFSNEDDHYLGIVSGSGVGSNFGFGELQIRSYTNTGIYFNDTFAVDGNGDMRIKHDATEGQFRFQWYDSGWTDLLTVDTDGTVAVPGTLSTLNLTITEDLTVTKDIMLGEAFQRKYNQITYWRATFDTDTDGDIRVVHNSTNNAIEYYFRDAGSWASSQITLDVDGANITVLGNLGGATLTTSGQAEITGTLESKGLTKLWQEVRTLNTQYHTFFQAMGGVSNTDARFYYDRNTAEFQFSYYDGGVWETQTIALNPNTGRITTTSTIKSTGGDIWAGLAVLSSGGMQTLADQAYSFRDAIGAETDTDARIEYNSTTSIMGLSYYNSGWVTSKINFNIEDGDIDIDRNMTAGGKVLQDGIFGELYISNGSTAQTIPTGTTYTKMTSWASIGQSSNMAPSGVNSKIVITEVGRYKVTVFMNGQIDTANTEMEMIVYLGGTLQNTLHCVNEFVLNNTNYSTCISGIIDVTDVTGTNGEVDTRIRHDDGGDVDFTMVNANMTIEYLGRT